MNNLIILPSQKKMGTGGWVGYQRFLGLTARNELMKNYWKV